MIYQTNLNLFVSVFTLVLGACLTTKFQSSSSKVSTNAVAFYDILWHHSYCWACCITFVYWFGLYNGQLVTLSNVLAHGTNSVVFLVDMYVMRCSLRLRSVLFTLIYTLIYLAFTFLYGILGGVNKWVGQWSLIWFIKKTFFEFQFWSERRLSDSELDRWTASSSFNVNSTADRTHNNSSNHPS